MRGVRDEGALVRKVKGLAFCVRPSIRPMILWIDPRNASAVLVRSLKKKELQSRPDHWRWA